MKKTNVGIIVPGDPEKVWKVPMWVRILHFIGRYGLFISIILGFGYFINIFTSPNELTTQCYLDLFLKFPFVTFLFYAVSEGVCSVKRRCPYCHHYFQMERISDDNYVGSSSQSVSRRATDYGSGSAYDLDGNFAFFNTKRHYTEYGTQTTDNYTYNMRCRCCGCVNKVEKQKTRTSY